MGMSLSNKPSNLRSSFKRSARKWNCAFNCNLDDPSGYGRIVRHNGSVVAIVEQKDASQEQKSICEINTGVMVANGNDLKRWLAALGNDNAQGEYYLTDVIAAAHHEGRNIEAVHPENPIEVEGVNDRVQLARLEREFQQPKPLRYFSKE